MLNTKLFNPHDVILIGCIAIIFHIVTSQLFAKVGMKDKG